MTLVDTKKARIFITLGLKLELNKYGQAFISQLLKERLDHTYSCFTDLQKSQPLPYLFMVSGRGIHDIEAKHMANYLKQTYKISNEMIFEENKSMITVENFIFSYFYLWKLYCKSQTKINQLDVHVVTSDYHKDRSKFIYDSLSPQFQRAFDKVKLETACFYGSPTQQQKEILNYPFINNQIQKFQDPLFDWRKYALDRYLDSEDQQLFGEFSRFLHQ